VDNRQTFSAIVLAAGYSTRMQAFKPLLALGRERVVERTVAMFKDAGITDIVVVVGHRAADLRPILAPLDVRCVENPDYSKGMFCSIVAGVRALPPACDGFFVHPVDIPLVRPYTVARIVAAFAAGRMGVVYPIFAGQRGHPPLIDAGLAPRLLEWAGKGGLRGFLDGIDVEQVYLPVADEAVCLDMDTPADYQRLRDRFDHLGVPTIDECRVLMDEIVELPPRIKNHCHRVAAVARQVAVAVAAAGLPIDVDQVHTAALLHDIARLQKDHAAAGARLLASHGFSRIAPAVAAHMALEDGCRDPIDAAQIVYLADKLVDGDRLVGLARRFARAKAQFGRDPSAAAAIERRLAAAQSIQERVETITGRSLDALIGAVADTEGS
jgi:molybdenum cofactor cytidylyltransferase